MVDYQDQLCTQSSAEGGEALEMGFGGWDGVEDLYVVRNSLLNEP